MKRHPFRRQDRIRSSLDFQHVYDQRHRAGDRHLLIFAAENGLPHPRLGLSVSRKHGPAVRRNRIKRLLREAFRLVRHELPAGIDLVVIPRIESGAELADYRRSLKKLAGKLARRFRGDAPQ